VSSDPVWERGALPYPPLLIGSNNSAPTVGQVDGRRAAIEGREEVVLRYGEASITLQRSGKVTIRGLCAETHAAGTNRIK